MARPKKSQSDAPAPAPVTGLTTEQITAIVSAVAAASSNSTSGMTQAFVDAINIAKPMEKKTPGNRKINTPWTPKDGSPKLKLKRQCHQHGILIDPDYLTNAEIDLFNKVRPGLYMDGNVKVYRRKDRGIDISYPVRTAAQRLRLVNMYGIRNLKELLERCISESENPTKKDQVDPDEY